LDLDIETNNHFDGKFGGSFGLVLKLKNKNWVLSVGRVCHGSLPILRLDRAYQIQ